MIHWHPAGTKFLKKPGNLHSTMSFKASGKKSIFRIWDENMK
jgi:hypothetical protein